MLGGPKISLSQYGFLPVFLTTDCGLLTISSPDQSPPSYSSHPPFLYLRYRTPFHGPAKSAQTATPASNSRQSQTQSSSAAPDRKSTRLNSSHIPLSRMPSSA